MKHQGTGCDRSWLQFIGIWRKYGREFGIPFPTKNFKLSISVTLPASQCHAAREVQRGPYVVNLPLKAWLQCYKHIHQFCRFSIAYSWNDEKRLWVHHKILSTEYHLRIVPRKLKQRKQDLPLWKSGRKIHSNPSLWCFLSELFPSKSLGVSRKSMPFHNGSQQLSLPSYDIRSGWGVFSPTFKDGCATSRSLKKEREWFLK